MLPISSAEHYEFVIDTNWYTAPVILLNVNGQLEFICSRSDVEDTAYVLRNIKEALGKGFDAKGHAKHSHRLSIVEKAKRLLLPSSYPHFAPFINHPYPAERPNAIFVDPNDWIPPLTRGKMAPAPADLAYLVQEARASDLTPSRLDYLQRPAVKTLRRIRSGDSMYTGRVLDPLSTSFPRLAEKAMQWAFFFPSMSTNRPTTNTPEVVRSKCNIGGPPWKRAVTSTSVYGRPSVCSAAMHEAQVA
jgi:hypothetical protein